MTAERLTDEECRQLSGSYEGVGFRTNYQLIRAAYTLGESRGLQRAAEIAREEGNCAENGVLMDCLYCYIAAAIDREREGQKVGERPPRKDWHCAKCGKPMRFMDGICFDCNGGRDPGD